MQQTQFKIGDKVREIATGDEGIIEDEGYSSPYWRINWKTGGYEGQTLGLHEEEFVLIESLSNEITFEQAMQALLQLGYKVTVEKI